MSESKSTTRDIPLFPLGTILFPEGVISLKIFEARYLDMMKQCLRDNSEFGVISILDSQDSDVDRQFISFSSVGTLARIDLFDPIQPALYLTKSIGTQRFKLIQTHQERDGLWLGTVELMADDPQISVPQEHVKIAELLDQAIQVIQKEGLLDNAPFKEPFKANDCGWVSNRLAELLPVSLHQKNHLLRQTNPRIRLDLVSEILEDLDFRNLIMH